MMRQLIRKKALPIAAPAPLGLLTDDDGRLLDAQPSGHVGKAVGKIDVTAESIVDLMKRRRRRIAGCSERFASFQAWPGGLMSSLPLGGAASLA